MANDLKIPEGEQELVCLCKTEGGEADNSNHKISEDSNGDILVECVIHTVEEEGEEVQKGCGRFRKYPHA